MTAVRDRVSLRCMGSNGRFSLVETGSISKQAIYAPVQKKSTHAKSDRLKNVFQMMRVKRSQLASVMREPDRLRAFLSGSRS